MKCKLMFAAAVLATVGGMSVAARADTLNFTLQSSTVATTPGAAATFFGTLSAPSTNSGDIYLNSDSFNLSSPALLDDTDFFTNTPLYLLPGQSVTAALFTVTSAQIGMFSGSYSIVGGANGGALNTLGTQSFTTNVTPEPSSWLLLATGMGAAVLVLGRKRWLQA